MNLAEIASLQPLVDKYTAKEWHLNKVGMGPENFSIRVKSPRMNFPFILPDVFTEDELLITEAEHIAMQNHWQAISDTFHKVANKMVADLGNLYLQQSRGKEVVIPDELTLQDLKVNLKNPTQ